MDNVNKTLYIPLYGKACVSRKGIILRDPKAEQIWAAEGFALKGKAKSKWLSYYMGMRAAVFDRWLEAQMEAVSDGVVLHIGCGMDSRCQRVGTRGHRWYDIDFPDVVEERKRYYRENEDYRMIGSDVTAPGWLEAIPGGNAIVVMEGVSMYLTPEKLREALDRIAAHFDSVHLLMDCYTTFAAKATKYKNPIKEVGVTTVFGMDDPNVLPGFVRELEMTPDDLIGQLRGMEQKIFRHVFAGGFAKKLYRLYEYER